MADIQELLHDAGVDFRDCYEKDDLVKRLRESEKQLPPSVRARLRSLSDRADGDTNPGVLSRKQAHEAPVQHLFNDEQYVVKVFNVSHMISSTQVAPILFSSLVFI